MDLPRIGQKVKVRIKQDWNTKGFSDKTMKVSFVKNDGQTYKCNECNRKLEKGEIQAVMSGIHVCWPCVELCKI